jgi:glycerol-3-phosphate O-acyltransferase/dihydroxyacetone phosphate acyltransferase
MALGAISKHKTAMYLLPCGLNYFKGYQFRSKVVIQFGVPYQIKKEILDEY